MDALSVPLCKGQMTACSCARRAHSARGAPEMRVLYGSW